MQTLLSFSKVSYFCFLIIYSNSDYKIINSIQRYTKKNVSYTIKFIFNNVYEKDKRLLCVHFRLCTNRTQSEIFRKIMNL